MSELINIRKGILILLFIVTFMLGRAFQAMSVSSKEDAWCLEQVTNQEKRLSELDGLSKELGAVIEKRTVAHEEQMKRSEERFKEGMKAVQDQCLSALKESNEQVNKCIELGNECTKTLEAINKTFKK